MGQNPSAPFSRATECGMLLRFGAWVFIRGEVLSRGDRPMAQKKPTVYEFIPKLGKPGAAVLLGVFWGIPDLTRGDGSLITGAMWPALNRPAEMAGTIRGAPNN